MKSILATALFLAKQEIRDKYLGQVIGMLWAILNPLLLIGMYVVLFTIVFPSRLELAGGGQYGAVLYILSGLVPWFASSEVLNRSTTALMSSPAIVRQRNLPCASIPLKEVLVPGVGYVISMAVVIAIAVALVHRPAVPMLLLFVPAFMIQFLALWGIALLLSALGPFLRDLRDVVAFFTSAGLFLAPILYTPERLAHAPGALMTIITLNPFSHIIWMYHDAFVYGRIAHPLSWVVSAFVAIASLGIGGALFKRLQPHFIEVI